MLDTMRGLSHRALVKLNYELAQELIIVKEALRDATEDYLEAKKVMCDLQGHVGSLEGRLRKVTQVFSERKKAKRREGKDFFGIFHAFVKEALGGETYTKLRMAAQELADSEEEARD